MLIKTCINSIKNVPDIIISVILFSFVLACDFGYFEYFRIENYERWTITSRFLETQTILQLARGISVSVTSFPDPSGM